MEQQPLLLVKDVDVIVGDLERCVGYLFSLFGLSCCAFRLFGKFSYLLSFMYNLVQHKCFGIEMLLPPLSEMYSMSVSCVVFW